MSAKSQKILAEMDAKAALRRMGTVEEVTQDMQDKGKAPPSIQQALADADYWGEECEAGRPIPKWALSLRVLAGSYRRARPLASSFLSAQRR